MKKTQIRSLRPGESRPEGEPRRYADPRGYVRLRWKVAPCSYVEVYEHRLEAGLPDANVRVHPYPNRQRDPELQGHRSRSAMERAKRAETRRQERAALVKEIVRLYREGKTTIEVGEILGRDPSNISRALRSVQFAARKPWDHHPPLDADETVRLYVEEKVQPAEIAHRLGVGEVRVRKVLTARGVMRRPGRPKRSGRRSYAQEFAEIRPRILTRAGHQCEVGLSGCERRAVHVHHRKLRSQGGKNDACNLIAACSSCHQEVHRSPARSYATGWMVRSTEDPALVPTQLARGLVMIGNDLRYYVPEPSAVMPI